MASDSTFSSDEELSEVGAEETSDVVSCAMSDSDFDSEADELEVTSVVCSSEEALGSSVVLATLLELVLELVSSAVVVSSAAAAAAALKEDRSESDKSQYGEYTPALEQRDVAKLVAATTSDPLQFSAIHSATSAPQFSITQRHPVSQYGQGVLPVSSFTQGCAQEGRSP